MSSSRLVSPSKFLISDLYVSLFTFSHALNAPVLRKNDVTAFFSCPSQYTNCFRCDHRPFVSCPKRRLESERFRGQTNRRRGFPHVQSDVTFTAKNTLWRTRGHARRERRRRGERRKAQKRREVSIFSSSPLSLSFHFLLFLCVFLSFSSIFMIFMFPSIPDVSLLKRQNR